MCQAFNRLRLLYTSRYILSSTQKLLLSQSLVVSLFDYCDVVYSPFLTSRLSSLVQRVQNSCLRFSYCARKFDHISPFFVKSSWLRMSQRWKLHLCCLVFKVLSSRSPSYLYNIQPTNLSYHSSNSLSTRSQSLISIPAHRTTKFESSFSYTAAHYYNSLPAAIRQLDSYQSFKHAVRQHILQHF